MGSILELRKRTKEEEMELEEAMEWLKEHAIKVPETKTELEIKLIKRIGFLEKYISEQRNSCLEKALTINKLENQLNDIKGVITVKEYESTNGETWAQIVARIWEEDSPSEILLIFGQPKDIENKTSDFWKYIKIFGLEEKLNSLHIV
jgi:hypothetical protein